LLRNAAAIARRHHGRGGRVGWDCEGWDCAGCGGLGGWGGSEGKDGWDCRAGQDC